jgi:3-hydroxypropanoate dehydrogenase
VTHETDDSFVDRVFSTARSRNRWSDRSIAPETLARLYDLVKLGPTSMNCSPARFRFLLSDKAKQRLAPHLAEGNRIKTLTAPCVAIIAYDSAFYDMLPKLFPIREGMRDMFANNEALASSTAFRNGTLQGAYLIIAARALGLDCGPMSGFNNAGVDHEFFAGTLLKSNFLCALGYANDELLPRLPRLTFEEAATVL